MRAGVTLNLETPVEAAFPYLDQIDDLMLMSIRPGWSGQELNPDVYPRIEPRRGPRWTDKGSRSTSRSTGA